jgi:tetratricopeptide (TPR) repeat protein
VLTRTAASKKRASGPARPHPRSAPNATFRICVVILLAALAAYIPTIRFGFVNFDDPEYVSNPHVRGGITADGIRWALISDEAANWFPVTRISHMLDAQLFGMRSGMHHAVNVVIHALAAALLFLFLNRATRARWPSAFVAMVFALHPLHVESVAWVAERKDVLSALFWFSALWAYVRYTERPDWRRYALVAAAFALGLMSKPMIVTLPFALLLLDFWPLGRWGKAGVIREKLPLFALAGVGAAITYGVQRSGGAVQSLSGFPLGLRLETALTTYVTYIAKTFWPARLAVFYPYPAEIPVWRAVLAGVAIAAITGLALTRRRAHPYLITGWLWYLGTLVPVIGLVQVGAQARADRYMYVPMVGLLIMPAWGAAEFARRGPRLKTAVIWAGGAACLASAAGTWVQVSYWKDSEALFRHALEVTDGNYLAHHNLGVALAETSGGLPEAIEHFEAALRIKPDYARARTDLATALSRIPGRENEALAEDRAALRTSPHSAITHNNLGNTLLKMPGRLPEAIAEYETALRLDPGYAEAHNNLGAALMKAGRASEAIAQFQAALRIDSGNAEAHRNLGAALADRPGRLPEAIAELEAAVRLEPGSAEAHINLANALASSPARQTEAIAQYEAALGIDPNSVDAHVDLGSALAGMPGRLAEAIAQYETALRIEPDSAEAHYNLGVALSKAGGREAETIAHFETALRLRPDYAEAHNNLGVVLSNIPGRFMEAITHFQAAARLKPDYADAHYNLGAALSNIPGRLPAAIAELETALRLRPDEETRQALNRLRGSAR